MHQRRRGERMRILKSKTFVEDRGDGLSDRLRGKSSEEQLCNFVNKNKIEVIGIGSGWGRWDNRFTLFYKQNANCTEDEQ